MYLLFNTTHPTVGIYSNCDAWLSNWCTYELKPAKESGFRNQQSASLMFKNLYPLQKTPHQSTVVCNNHAVTSVFLVKVSGVDLRDASHEQAVEAIRQAGDSVVLVVQSGQERSLVLFLRRYKYSFLNL